MLAPKMLKQNHIIGAVPTGLFERLPQSAGDAYRLKAKEFERASPLQIISLHRKSGH